MKKEFYDAYDISKITGRSLSSSRTLLQKINKDIRKEGYKTLWGLVSAEQFNKRFGSGG